MYRHGIDRTGSAVRDSIVSLKQYSEDPFLLAAQSLFYVGVCLEHVREGGGVFHNGKDACRG